MKVLIYSDVHWSQTSSIVRDIGKKYTVRLEHLIDSLNWAENLAIENSCDEIFVLGDFFDKSHLNTLEITALSDIKWANLPHKFLLGNHEMKDKNKEYSSLHLFKLLGFDLITEPFIYKDKNYDLCFLPYMFEYSSIEELFPTNKKRIVFSHNDVEGVQLGGYIFDKGFSLENINNSCELFLNGHIHSKGKIGKVLNVGNLCGQNFTENGDPHNAYILDTETLELQEFENPYSLNFYKVDYTKYKKIPSLKNNFVIRVKFFEEDLEKLKNKFKDAIAVKWILIPKNVTDSDVENKIEKIDHLQSLRDYIFNELGETDAVKEEIEILTK